MFEFLPQFLIFIVIAFFIFLIIREIMLWYYKINERIEEQKRTNFLLEKILEQLGGKIENQTNVEDFRKSTSTEVFPNVKESGSSEDISKSKTYKELLEKSQRIRQSKKDK